MTIATRLEIHEARSKDRGRGIARIDLGYMKTHKIQSGDVIQLENPKNGRKTACVVGPGLIKDSKKPIIRIDDAIRRNAWVSIGDEIFIWKIQVQPAKRVCFARVNSSIQLINVQYFAQVFENRVMTVGDQFRLKLRDRYLDLMVVRIEPGAGKTAQITPKTQIEIDHKIHRTWDTRNNHVLNVQSILLNRIPGANFIKGEFYEGKNHLLNHSNLDEFIDLANQLGISILYLDLVKSNGKFTDLVELIRFNDDGVIHTFQISKLHSNNGN